MLGAMATVAYQTIFTARNKWRDTDGTTKRPVFLNTCHAFATDGEIVKKSWPEFYTGS
jgi:endonuclease IV